MAGRACWQYCCERQSGERVAGARAGRPQTRSVVFLMFVNEHHCMHFGLAFFNSTMTKLIHSAVTNSQELNTPFYAPKKKSEIGYANCVRGVRIVAARV